MLSNSELRSLLMLRDHQCHNDIPKGLSVGQYIYACSELKAKGLIHFAPEGPAAQIKDKGEGVIDDYIQEKQSEKAMIDIKDLEPEEKKFILYVGNNKKYESYYDEIEDDYDVLSDKFVLEGYLKLAISNDHQDSLTKKGKRLYDEIEKAMLELNELDIIMLDYLCGCTDYCHDIKNECEDLRYYSKKDIYDAAIILKNKELVEYFDEPNDYYNVTFLSITDKGRKYMRERNSKMQDPIDDSVVFKRKDNKGEIIEKRISAREICDIIRAEKKLNVMTKVDWESLLSKITGLSKESFRNYL